MTQTQNPQIQQTRISRRGLKDAGRLWVWPAVPAGVVVSQEED